MFTDEKRTSLTRDEFLEVIQTIEGYSTINGLMIGAAETLGVKYSFYQHFPAVGAFDFNKVGEFHGYNTPDYIKAYYRNKHTLDNDPVLSVCLAKGKFCWFSDSVKDPVVVASEHYDQTLSAFRLFGDGSCCPLYGPDKRIGYAFAGFGRDKSDFDPILPYQIQSILQIMHVQYCLLIKGLQRQINLTPRESEVLELISYGKTNPEIADIMKISPYTVAGYAKKVFVKLGTSDRVSAALRAQTMDIYI